MSPTCFNTKTIPKTPARVILTKAHPAIVADFKQAAAFNVVNGKPAFNDTCCIPDTGMRVNSSQIYAAINKINTHD